MRYLFLFVSILAAAHQPSSFAQSLLSIDRTSETSSGSGQVGQVGVPVISANGKFVAFTSTASNLVSGDTNSNRDVFVKNILNGAVTRVNLGLAQVQANDDSFNVSISPSTPKGFAVVVFESDATNISRTLQSDTNNRRDIYFSIPVANNLTERISYGPNGVEPNGNSNNPSVAVIANPNRILVAYSSVATNLVTGDTNNSRDIFLSILTAPLENGGLTPSDVVTTRISLAADPSSEANNPSFSPQISGNGKFIVFESLATNLVSGVTPSSMQIYRYDIENETTILVSKSLSGTPGDGISTGASISFGGRYVSYLTNSNNIVNDGFTLASNVQQVMLFDTKTGITERINTAPDGTPSDGLVNSNFTTFISPAGRFVVFSDEGTNLVSSDSNGISDVFVKDRGTGELIRVSEGIGGVDPDDESFFGTFGQQSYTATVGLASFGSAATNLVSGDVEGQTDTFVASISIPKLPLTEDTEIEVPPDVASKSEKAVTVTMQEFDGATLSALAAQHPQTSKLLGQPKVQYVVKSSLEGKSQKIKKIIKKNVVSLSKLKQGTHVISYQAQIVRKNKKTKKNKVIFKTPFSPEERACIGTCE